jgi:hypothetical protein
MISDLATIVEVSRAILQLMLLCCGAILCVLTAAIVSHLLGWHRP